MAHTSSDIYQKSPFPCSQVNLSSTEDNSSRKKPEGPYCRHCDVLIIGIGVKRKPDDTEVTKKPTAMESSETDTEIADYKIYRVNVEAGDCTGDIFCSDACLKQYFAHVGSECSSLTQQPRSELNALQPRLDVSVSSEGQTSVGAGNVTSLNETDTRGGVIADGLSPTSLRKIRNPSWKEEEDEEVRNCFVFVRVLQLSCNENESLRCLTRFRQKARLLCRILEFVAAYLLPVLSHLSSSSAIKPTFERNTG